MKTVKESKLVKALVFLDRNINQYRDLLYDYIAFMDDTPENEKIIWHLNEAMTAISVASVHSKALLKELGAKQEAVKEINKISTTSALILDMMIDWKSNAVEYVSLAIRDAEDIESKIITKKFIGNIVRELDEFEVELMSAKYAF